MAKARWTRWQGGHGRLDAYSLELGYLVKATVKRKAGGDVWAVEINMRPQGEYPSKDAAFKEVDTRIRQYARDFIEDWAVWTVCADGALKNRVR